jgi:carbon-monoxide dehydrogenase medium subunit/6-hydroxypseudooxynicotine dehydrogenase subunit alpha
MPPRTGHAFVEYSRRHGDFALGGAAVLVTVDEAGACERAAIALLAAGPTPIRATAAEDMLRGERIDDSVAAAAAARAVAPISPTGDIHGSGGYRKDLIEVMVLRALKSAAERAETAMQEGRSANGASAV